MDKVRSQAVLIGTSLLGVIAVCAIVVGVFLLFGAWTIWRGVETRGLDGVGVAGALMLGLLSIAFGAMAVAAAYEEWLGRAPGSHDGSDRCGGRPSNGGRDAAGREHRRGHRAAPVPARRPRRRDRDPAPHPGPPAAGDQLIRASGAVAVFELC